MKLINLKPHEAQLRTKVSEYLDTLINKTLVFGEQEVKINVNVKELVPKQAGKLTVQFTPEAWVKLNVLVSECSKEIGAHGTVTKTQTGYLIEDILVYPQEVTAATVVATDAYGSWLMELPEEDFNKLRFQMHSHVNMSATPSGVDDRLYEQMMADVEDYYIFMIMNKSGKVFINVYDVENNCIYETDDIATSVLLEDQGTTKEWYTAVYAEQVTEPKPITHSAYASGYWNRNTITPGTSTVPEKKKPGRPKKETTIKKEEDVRAAEIRRSENIAAAVKYVVNGGTLTEYDITKHWGFTPADVRTIEKAVETIREQDKTYNDIYGPNGYYGSRYGGYYD